MEEEHYLIEKASQKLAQEEEDRNISSHDGAKIPTLYFLCIHYIATLPGMDNLWARKTIEDTLCDEDVLNTLWTYHENLHLLNHRTRNMWTRLVFQYSLQETVHIGFHHPLEHEMEKNPVDIEYWETLLKKEDPSHPVERHENLARYKEYKECKERMLKLLGPNQGTVLKSILLEDNMVEKDHERLDLPYPYGSEYPYADQGCTAWTKAMEDITRVCAEDKGGHGDGGSLPKRMRMELIVTIQNKDIMKNNIKHVMRW